MLPLSPETPLDARETMASVPDAVNLVKSGRSGAGSLAMGTQHGSAAVDDNRDRPTTVETLPGEYLQVKEGSSQGSVTHVALPVASANDLSSRQGSNRFAFREPTQILPQPDAEKRAPQGIVGNKDQILRMTATNGANHRAVENGHWMEKSAARPNATDVQGATNNARRDANSDDEYIDVETLDPVEERRHSLLEQSRRVVPYTRAQYEGPADHQQNKRRAADTGGEHSATDDERVASLDSGFYSDEEVRVRMRGSSSDWSDSVGDTCRSKEISIGRFPSSVAIPEDADKSRSHSYQRVHAVNDDSMVFSPPPSTNTSEWPVPHHEIQQEPTLKQVVSTAAPCTIPVTYVKSYGGYTVYIPGKVHSAEKETCLSSNGSVRVPDTVSTVVGRNSTEVVYTMDTSAVRMSTTTSSIIDSRGLCYNTKPSSAVVQRKSVLVVTGDEDSSEEDLNRPNTEDYRVSVKNTGMKSYDRSDPEVLPDGRDEVSRRYLQQFSSYSPDRAVIIPIPSEKSAFVNTTPSSTEGFRLKAVAAPARYIRVEESEPEARNSSKRNASDFERMGPPLETVRRYIPSSRYPPRAYVTHPYRMVAKKPVSSRVDFDSTVLHTQGNGKYVHHRSDARMTPENSGERGYVYHHSKPLRVVYTPISGIADDEPPSKMARLSCGRERLLSIAEIEHESVTAARQTRYPMAEAEIVSGQSRSGEGDSTNLWPLGYGSHILKTYLRGRDVLEQESLRRSNSPVYGGELSDSETGAERDLGPWFRSREHAEEEVGRSYRREERTIVDTEGVVRGHDGSYRRGMDDFYCNGDASGTLDLSKKDRRGGEATEDFAEVQPRYSSSEGSYPSAELRARLLGGPVASPASVIVRSGSRSDGEQSKRVVRTVIVSAGRSKASGGQRLTEPEPEVRAEGRDAEPATVLAPEPGGRRSRYSITREGGGSRLVIREVAPAAGQLVAMKARLEGDLAGAAPAGHFEPTAAERAWADAEWAAWAARAAADEAAVYGAGAAGGAGWALRRRVWVALWALVGGGRLSALGWPRAPPRRLLWRAVAACCAAAGARPAAALPLPADHDCGADMACFRDHAHRLLEVCAPTRDHWKRYGWAALTTDAAVAKLYAEDIEPWLRSLPDALVPEAVRCAARDLAAAAAPPPPPPRAAPPPQPPPPAAQEAEGRDARKRRGRPARPAAGAEAAGRVERVMLWRFLLNLLEDPRNEACIHWVSRDQGIFRILNTDWLARLWGRRHGNPRMTYEKMARAMRTYYRSKVLQPVPRSPNLPRKLVYKFNPAVVQRVAAANKLAEQQQQQRHPRLSAQCEGDQPQPAPRRPQPRLALYQVCPEREEAHRQLQRAAAGPGDSQRRHACQGGSHQPAARAAAPHHRQMMQRMFLSPGSSLHRRTEEAARPEQGQGQQEAPVQTAS